MRTLKVGIVSTYLQEEIFTEYFQESEHYDLVAYYDLSADTTIDKSNIDINFYTDWQEFLDLVDVVLISCSTDQIYSYAEKVLKKSKHIIFDNFIGVDIIEAKQILELSQEANVEVHITNMNRKLLVMDKLEQLDVQPKMIQIRDIKAFNRQGSLQSNNYKQLIQNIGWIIRLSKANIKQIRANSIALLSEKPDTFQIFLEFDNGSTALLHLGATSEEQGLSHTLQLFENRRKITVNLLSNQIHIESYHDQTVEGAQSLTSDEVDTFQLVQNITVQQEDPLEKQLSSFALSILKNQPHSILLNEDIKVLEVSQVILDKIYKWMSVG